MRRTIILRALKLRISFLQTFASYVADPKMITACEVRKKEFSGTWQKNNSFLKDQELNGYSCLLRGKRSQKNKWNRSWKLHKLFLEEPELRIWSDLCYRLPHASRWKLLREAKVRPMKFALAAIPMSLPLLSLFSFRASINFALIAYSKLTETK